MRSSCNLNERREPMRRTALLTVLGAVFLATVAMPALATTPEPLTITVDRGAAGDFWSASGTFTDSGTLADNPQRPPTRSGTYHVVRTYSGAAGTFAVRADVKIVPTSTPGVFAVTGYWTIISGTGAYADLHGTGTLSETFDANAGTVTGSWEGSAHFD
jgi:hypothetical protein